MPPGPVRLADPAFANPLLVHMHALLTVCGAQVPTTGDTIRERILDAVLDRERDRWAATSPTGVPTGGARTRQQAITITTLLAPPTEIAAGHAMAIIDDFAPDAAALIPRRWAPTCSADAMRTQPRRQHTARAVRRGGRVDAALGACRTDLRIMWRPLLVFRAADQPMTGTARPRKVRPQLMGLRQTGWRSRRLRPDPILWSELWAATCGSCRLCWRKWSQLKNTGRQGQ